MSTWVWLGIPIKLPELSFWVKQIYLVDAAIYHQFEKYLEERNVTLAAILSDEDQVQKWGGEFLSDTYPGVKGVPPNQLVRLMTSENLNGTLVNQEILFPEDSAHCSGGSSTTPDTTECPVGWQNNGQGSCLYLSVSHLLAILLSGVSALRMAS